MKKKTSKKVVQKDNPQKIINQLKDDLSNETKRKERAERDASKVENVLNSIAEIVKYKGSSGMFGNTSTRLWDDENLSELIGEVSLLTRAVQSDNTAHKTETRMLTEENRKLWHLIRAVMKDETLKQDVKKYNIGVDMGIENRRNPLGPSDCGPFNNPHF